MGIFLRSTRYKGPSKEHSLVGLVNLSNGVFLIMFLNFSSIKYARKFSLIIGVAVFSASAFANGTPAANGTATPSIMICDGEDTYPPGGPNARVVGYHHIRLELITGHEYPRYSIEFFEREPGGLPSYEPRGKFAPENLFAGYGGSGALVINTASPAGVRQFSISLLDSDLQRVGPNEFRGEGRLDISFPGVSGTGLGSNFPLQCRVPGAFLQR